MQIPRGEFWDRSNTDIKLYRQQKYINPLPHPAPISFLMNPTCACLANKLEIEAPFNSTLFVQ